MGPYQVLPIGIRVYQVVMAMKGCFTLPRSHGLQPHHQMQLSVISGHSFFMRGGGLILCRRYNQHIPSPADSGYIWFGVYVYVCPYICVYVCVWVVGWMIVFRTYPGARAAMIAWKLYMHCWLVSSYAPVCTNMCARTDSEFQIRSKKQWDWFIFFF